MTSLILAVAAIVSVVALAPPMDAATCTTTGGGGQNWSNPAAWNCGAGPSTYPGQNPGDIASLNVSRIVDINVPNAVTVNAPFSTFDIPVGGALTLQPSSTICSCGNAVNINGGTLTINGGGTFTPQGPVVLNTGQLTLASGAVMSATGGGALAFHGGTLFGPGQLTVPTGYSYSFDGVSGMIIDGGANIQVDGTLTYSASGANTLSLNGGSHITVNGPNGLFNINTTNQLQTNNTGGPSIDINTSGTPGILRNTLISGTGTINVLVNNGGAVQSNNAALQLAGGGTHAGSFSGAGTANPAIVFSGNHSFNAGTTFATPPVSTAYRFTGSGSTFSFPGAVSIPAFKWDGGTISGGGTVTLPTGGIIDASAAPLLLATVLQSQGAVTFTPGSFTVNSPGKLQMTGSPSASINFPTGTSIAGTGTIQADTNGGITAAGTVSIAPPVNLLQGSLSLTSGGGTTLTLSGGGSVDAASTFNLSTGSNTVKFTGGTMTFADTTPVLGPGGFQVAGATLAFSAATSPLAAGVLLDSGAISVPSAATTLTLSGGLLWNGGSLLGPGTITSSNIVSSPSPTGPLVLGSAAHYVNNGTFNFTPTFGLSLGAGTIFDAGSFNFLNDGSVTGTGTFNVNGGLTKTAGAGAATFNVPVTIGVSGSVAFSGTPATATFAFAGGGSMAGGSMNSLNGGFSFPSGTFTVSSGTMIGAGKYAVTGTGVLNLGTPLSIQSLQVAGGGTLNANAALNVTSALNLGGSTIGGTGSVTVTSPASVAVSSSPNTVSPSLTLTGAPLNLAASGALQLSGGGSESAAITTGASSTLGFSGGSFNVNSPGSIANSGIVQVTGGTLALNAGSSYSGSGTLTVNGGTLTLGVPIAAQTFNLFAGSLGGSTLTITGAGAFKGGTVTGGGLTTGATAALTWSGGTFASGTLTNNGLLSVDGAVGPVSFNGTLTNSGTVAIGPTLANPLTFSSASTIANSTAAAVFDFKADGVFASGSPIPFTNAGTLKKSAGSGTSATTFSVNNTGTVGAQSGTLQVASINQTGASAITTTSAGATIATTPGAFTMSAGILNGFGTMAGNVTNNGGAVNPGSSPGTLTVNGNFTQTAGSLNLEIQGTGAGQYDVLNVTGTATLGGTLNVTTLAPYTPTGGNSFTMMTYASKSGAFATTNVPPGGFTVTPGPTSLAVVVTQADISVTQSSPASPVFHGQPVTFTVTVTNLGGSNASAVSLSDSFSGGTFVSATPSQGTCSFTTSVNCSLGGLASGASATVQVTVNASAIGSITNQASGGAPEFDPNNSNNTAAPASVTVVAASDLALSVSHSPDPINVGASTTYTFKVDNTLGPDPASSFTLALTASGGTISGITGSGMTCTFTSSSATCSGSPLSVGSNATATVTFVASSLTGASMSGTVTSTSDPVSTNNTASQAVNVLGGADLAVSKSGPSSAHPGDQISYTITVTNLGPTGATGVALFDPLPAGLTLKSISGAKCSDFPCDLGSLSPNASVTVTATYTVNANQTATIENNAGVLSQTQDPNTSNNASKAITSIAGCGATPPSPVSPVGGVTVSSPVTFVWNNTPGATQYEVFVTSGSNTVSAGKTSQTSLSGVTVPAGPLSWYVVATVANCGTVQSSSATLNACNVPGVPLASVVANAASGQSYYVEWQAATDATSYDVDESSDASFNSPLRTTVQTGNRILFAHVNTTPSAQPYFYRVRGKNSCGNGEFSLTVRAVVAAQSNNNTTGASVPSGSTLAVLQTIFIPGQPDGTYAYSATVDKSWLSLDRPTGTLPPAGTTIGVLADPSTLPNGTFTGTVIVTLTPLATSSVRTQGTTTVSVPVSISLVTPVTPSNKTATTSNALIIPSVGHLDGINSQWQSDIRLANVGFSKQQYALTFTPSTAVGGSGATGVKTTNITVDAGATTALDDVVRNWYGVGSLGETANGVLEIKSLTNPQDGPGNTITTVASSRTYNTTTAGTLGQYIPAIPFTSFVGKAIPGAAQTILSLQQVQQSAAYRTNVGIVEGGGASANVTLSVYDGAGNKLKDFAQTLNPYQQVQLNSFLTQAGITNLADGRIEVKVTSGEGKVTAYASVVDNVTNDPFLVSAVPVGGTQSDRYILPGVAALNNGTANWQTDMRIFNAGTSTQQATLTLYPLNGGSPLTTTTLLNAGEIKQLDRVVQSLFSQSNLGGALHVITGTLSNLVVTGRTYNQTATGTYGQFVPAVTASDAASLGGRSLNVLQVEDSPRYRTNLGIAEVSGKPATVQIMVFLPDSKVTPKIEIPLAAYEYKQFPVIQSLGLGNIYNARLNIQVIGGDGKVTSYASVIDQTTQDPTYVPAQ